MNMEPISEVEYAFLGIAICKTVEERVEEKKAASREKTRAVARKIVSGVFKLPSCCCIPTTLETDDRHPRVATIPPRNQLHRKVIIYSPHSRSKQQPMSKKAQWRIGFEATSKWESSLGGWTPTGDSYLGVGEPGLHFDSREAAITFAKKYGWSYKVKEVKHQRNLSMDNYNWVEPDSQKTENLNQ